MELSKENKAILAHVVIDPDAWVEHALATVGEWAVIAKIAKYKPDYLAQKSKPEYKTRAERKLELEEKREAYFLQAIR